MPPDAGHGDGRAALGHRVHGGADQRDVELDGARQAALDVDLTGQHLAVRRRQQHVVEGQAFAQLVVEHRYLPWTTTNLRRRSSASGPATPSRRGANGPFRPQAGKTIGGDGVRRA